MAFLREYLVAVVAFFAVDIIWLGVVAKDLYRKEIGFIMAPSPNWAAVAVFYLIYIFGLIFFVVHPALAKDSWTEALFIGLLFGFITYATYDLTNLATLKDWPIRITIIDLIWGTTLGGSVSVITFFVVKLLRWQ